MKKPTPTLPKGGGIESVVIIKIKVQRSKFKV